MLSRPRPVALVVSVLLAVSAGLFAVPAHAATTTVTGVVKVRESAGATPVAKADLRVVAVPVGGQLSDPGLESAVPSATNGTFTLAVATEGDYHLYVEETATAAEYASEWWDDAAARSAAQAVTLTGGTHALSHDVVLDKLPTVTSAVPTITGTPTVGEVLTAHAGNWGPSGVDLTYRWSMGSGTLPSGWTTITEATSSMLTLGAAQEGKHIKVEVRGTLAGHLPAAEESDETGFVQAAPVQQISSTQVRVSGEAEVGQTLTVDPGAWTPSGVQLAYQWFLGDTALPGATGTSLVLTDAMAGRAVRVRVTGSYGSLEPLADWSAWTLQVLDRPVTIAAGTPTIVGTPKVGTELSIEVGSWTPSGLTFTYQWFADGGRIGGATGRTFTPTAAQAGARLSVDVTATHPTARSVTAASEETSVVVGVLQSARPRIKGAPVLGKKLRAVPGTWGPSPVRLTYVWLRNGKVVKGARAATYKLTRKDVGKRISVRVSGERSGYGSVTQTSRATKKVRR